jgi:hypothetical protein
MNPQGTIERAYELAKNGPCTNVEEIRRQLRREQYSSVDAHLNGKATTTQLVQLCRARLSMEAEAAPQT